MRKNLFVKIISVLMMLSLVINLTTICTATTTENSETITNTNNEESSKPTTYDKIPLYSQCDYPDVPYSSGTVATSGCGITCLAMVATYLLDKEYLPDELAEKYNNREMTNVEKLEYGSADLQLPFVKKVYTTHQIMAALKQGQVAIVLVKEDSLFTDTGHFVVFTGLTEEGRILVNDPNGNNYKKYKLQYGFKNGFSQEDVLVGISGAWIYDKNGPVQEEEAEIISYTCDILFPIVQ
jgi:hypothetical protein